MEPSGPDWIGTASLDGGEAGAQYRTSDVARILGVSAERVRRLVRRGHCVPSRRGRAYRFDFRDLVLLRTAQRLLRSGGIPARRVHLALRQLQRQLPESRPASGLRIFLADGKLVARDRDTAWHPENGQQIFAFAVHDPVGRDGAMVAIGRWPARRPAPLQTAVDWFDYAVSIEGDDPNGARQAYERALQADPEFADAYVNLGRLVHDAGDARAAARFYAEALRRNAVDAVTHYNFAVACEDLGRRARARVHYEKAVAINPAFADAHFNLGRLLETSGETDAAVKHLLAYRRLSDR